MLPEIYHMLLVTFNCSLVTFIRSFVYSHLLQDVYKNDIMANCHVERKTSPIKCRAPKEQLHNSCQ